jgi:hypothetical protein
MIIKQLRAALWSVLVMIWAPIALLLAVPVVAHAAAVVETAQFALNLSPGLLVAFSILLSSLSGATALLYRIDKQLRAEPDKPLPRALLTCASHMAGSWVAGTLAFIGAQRIDSDYWGVFASVICASFVGAVYIEKAAERFLPTPTVR